MIYLASPYTHENAIVRENRYQQVLSYAYSRMNLGEVIFSPIVYGHPFVSFNPEAITAKYWAEFNHHMLTRSSEMHILSLEGWSYSRGVAAEQRIANLHSIPVKLIQPLEYCA